MRAHFIFSEDIVLQNLMSELSKTDIVTSKNEEITTETDLVVLSSEISETHPDILKASNLGLKTIFYPEFIHEYFKNKTRVVITGSKGKENVLAMVLHTMNFHDVPVSYFLENPINGKQFQLIEDAEFVLIEGDENLISNSNSQAKFLSYQPTVALITGISSEENSEKYSNFIDSLTKGGILIYNEEDSLLKNIVKTSENPVRKLEYKTPDYQTDGKSLFLLTDEGQLLLKNIQPQEVINVEGAKWVCQNMGIDEVDFYEAMVSFS
ncbi:Mur ligase [Capnocytophaga stomatis]|uniref:Mur ligase n=1 Tax=Capnocytophaga stomatis TaxID=1848904 RepID=UPI00385E08B3